MPRQGKAGELARWLEEHRPAQIGETEFARIRDALHPISEGYLRRLIRASGAACHPLVEGVRQATFQELDESLRKMLEEYQQGDAPRRAAVRRAVITAKDHARLAARNPAKRGEKEEMILWLSVWLENPPLFPDWVRIRREVWTRSH
jgi:hypothetical protein